MLKIIQTWFQRYFSDPEAVLLFFILLIGFGSIFVAGDVLAPVIASIVIAYFLQWWVVLLQRFKIPHNISYIIVYLGFLGIFAIGILILLPLMWKQFINLFNELPAMIQSTREMVSDFMEDFPYFTGQQIDSFINVLVQDAQLWGKKILSVSLASIPGVIAWFIYIILVPLLVFFFLKDYKKIIAWFVGFLPEKHTILVRVWSEMDEQIGNYIRGKITEIIIVGVITYFVFLYFGLRYQVLLSVLVGLSVVIPYVGAVVVSIPVILVGYLQWGFTATFAYMSFWYLVVQALDGNLLVPLLFSEAVNLHPIAIIVAILFFGAIWGFWGVLFAIPLATLFKAVLYAWPNRII